MSALERLLRYAYALAVVGFVEAFRFSTSVPVRDRVNCANDVFGQFPFEGQVIQSSLQRRDFIEHAILGVGSLLAFSPQPSFAGDEAILDTRETVATYVSPPNQKFRYTVTPPPSFAPSNKPLKTHLDEINFSPPDARGYTLGITVDPVRIKSIREFGTPEEVAARVVTAEVNRDGVFQVTLAKDPVEDTDAGGCYDIEYISEGKRGIKRFVTRIYIQDGFLYVLTVQSKEDEYDTSREKEVAACVKSFKPL
ncbi:hypothetical protein ACHAWX_007126 [Stephanocyclus meneghinianus]